MLPRLELLGYTLATVKAEYKRQVTRDAERNADDVGAPSPNRSERLEFVKFIDFARGCPLSGLDDEYRSPRPSAVSQ